MPFKKLTKQLARLGISSGEHTDWPRQTTHPASYYPSYPPHALTPSTNPAYYNGQYNSQVPTQPSPVANTALIQSTIAPDAYSHNGLCEVCCQQDWEYHFNRYWDDRLQQDQTVAREAQRRRIMSGPVDLQSATNGALTWFEAARHPWTGKYMLSHDSTKFSLQPYRFMITNRHSCPVCKLVVDAVESPQWSNDTEFQVRDGNSDQAVEIIIQGPKLSPHGFYTTAQMSASIHEPFTVPMNFQNMAKSLELTSVAYPDPNQIDAVTLMSWWSNCKQNHEGTCGPDYEARAGLQELGTLRVIDVLRKRVVSVSFNVDYVALSYCWGTAKVYKAVKSDFINGELSLHDKQLPRTIEDAITLTEVVGERYLWVDSVCIVQDDNEDVRHYVTQMHNIYKAARFTIINASATTADSGLEGLRPNSRNLRFAQGNIAGTSIIELPSRVTLGRSPWAERAWTFQENYFAANRIIFASGRAFYTCAAGIRTEHHQTILNQEQIQNSYLNPIVLDLSWLDWQNGPLDLPGGIALQSTSPCGGGEHGHQLSIYLQNATLYGRRRATFQSDSLNAFTGVLSHLQSKKHQAMDFCWGLPKQWLYIALGWTTFHSLLPSFINDVTQEHLDTFKRERCRWNISPVHGDVTKPRTWFPSWSWASCDYFFTYQSMQAHGARSNVVFPWEEEYLLGDAPDPFETGILRLYAECATLTAQEVRQHFVVAGVYRDMQPVLDDLSFWVEGSIRFMRLCDMAVESDTPAVQILGLVEVGTVDGARRWKRICCLRIPLSVWTMKEREHDAFDLV